jgi:glycosyltransferase involved in cell wall biosynthesis
MLNSSFFPLIGGVEQQMRQMAGRMRAAGNEVIIVTYRIHPHWKRYEVIDGVPVYRTGGLFIKGKLRRRWALATLPLLWELIRQRHRYDLIHVHSMLEAGFVAVVAGKLLNKPVVGIMGNAGETSEFRVLPRHDGLIGSWMSRIIRRSRAVIAATSSDVVEDLHTFQVSNDRIRRIPYGVDVHKFNATARVPRPESAYAPTCICVARLVYYKGHDVLLRAWQQVKQVFPGARLQLLGTGELMDSLKEQARQLGVDDVVEFVGETHDVAGYAARADMFVLPSRSEGLPNALLEAMSAGLPCVATWVSGSKDVIINGVTGLIVQPEDVMALANALLQFMAYPQFARECGQRARAFIEERYSFESVISQYYQLYAQMLSQTQGHHS